ncbi:ATP-binding protein [Ignavibacteria bacterium]|nr:heavy metal sensor histidine kinase [Bacteroidota bacterium]MCZ2132468.1 heavy metal sensor histidine kinase [Bacteroidota bacterium]
MKISLRLRLTAWYSMILAATLAVLGVSAYWAVQSDLQQNLEQSLQRVASALDDVIRKKQSETMRPLKPAALRQKKRAKKEPERPADNFAFFRNTAPPRVKDSSRADTNAAESAQSDEPDEVWTAVYEHILLNPKNYYIQIADPQGRIVWQSDNLQGDSLLMFGQAVAQEDENGAARIITRYTLRNQPLQMVLLRTRRAQISVGYTVEEIEVTLSELFFSLIVTFPVVLIISTLGGWFLARISLRPVDDIIDGAEEITAHNLSRRLPMPPANDEIARLTATLNRMIERLERSFIQIRQFTSDASHELRTPLAILMGEIEVALRREKTPAEYRETLSSALEEVARLSKVVRNLLDISRAETGQVKIAAEPFSISKLTSEIAEDIEVLAAEKNISLNAEIEPNIWITGDAARMHQALLNTLDNAVKYNRDGGNLRVTLRREAEDCIIEITDTGIGIPKEALPHIFDRFFRADKARSQDIQGNGLGLAIVKWIIEQHKGSIYVVSEEGSGTTFTIKLKAPKNITISSVSDA